MKFSPALVSVVIVVKNERGIGATLDHLRHLKLATPTETIVVDASRPEVLQDIRRRHSWVRWEQFPPSSRRTTPEQRNRGIELARGDVIVFIDANCVPAKQWLSSMVDTLMAGEDIVTGPVRNLNENNLVHYDPQDRPAGYVETCMTINVGMRRSVFERVGGFDTTFGYGQDVDFFWRSRDAGFRIYYNPQTAIAHNWGDSREQIRRAYYYGKSRAHLYKKHWRRRWWRLWGETDVWVYPLFLLGLPLTLLAPFYPLLMLVPLIKNWRSNPFGLVTHHLVYGVGVLAGLVTHWPRPAEMAVSPRG